MRNVAKLYGLQQLAAIHQIWRVRLYLRIASMCWIRIYTCEWGKYRWFRACCCCWRPDISLGDRFVERKHLGYIFCGNASTRVSDCLGDCGGHGICRIYRRRCLGSGAYVCVFCSHLREEKCNQGIFQGNTGSFNCSSILPAATLLGQSW